MIDEFDEIEIEKYTKARGLTSSVIWLDDYKIDESNPISKECSLLKTHLKDFDIGFTIPDNTINKPSVKYPHKPLIINITGFNNTGKDTTVKLIQDIFKEHNPNLLVENISIAQPIREMTAIATCENVDMFESTIEKELNTHIFNQFTRRELMIEISKKMFEIDKDFWWKITLKKIQESNANIITISDVRYLEWLEFLLENEYYDSKLLEVCRDNTSSQYPRLEPDFNIIKSGNFKITDNNSTLEKLKSDIMNILTFWELV